MRSFSLAGRLTIWYAASTILLITIAVTSLYWSLVSTFNNADRLVILDKMQSVEQLLTTHTDLNDVKNRVEVEWPSRKYEHVYVRLLDDHQNVITQSPDFESIAVNFPVSMRSILRSSFEKSKTSIQQLQDADHSHSYKFASVLLTENRTLLLVLNRTTEENILASNRARLLIILLFTSVIAAILGRRIAVKGVEPVIEIANAAKSITSTTLHHRLTLSKVPSELNVLVQTFNEMLDRLNESFERLSRFSQDIAHELRTPVNNIRGELEVALGRNRSPEEYKDVLGSCLEEGEKLTRLIDSLLFLARAENPSATLDIKKLKLKNEITTLIDFFETSASEEGLDFKIEIPDDLSLAADQILLQRVFANLFSNAIKYAQKNGTIIITAKQNTDGTCITVADNGIGIQSKHLDKIFDRFYRVDESRSSQTGGTGLGLSIVRSIMTLHKGSVRMESGPEQGTKIILQFPLA